MAGQVSPKALQWVENMEREYGTELVIAALGNEAKIDGTSHGFLGRVQGRLALQNQQQAKAREEAQKDRAIKEAEAHRARVENATPEELAKVEQNKAAIRAMVRDIASGSDE